MGGAGKKAATGQRSQQSKASTSRARGYTWSVYSPHSFEPGDYARRLDFDAEDEPVDAEEEEEAEHVETDNIEEECHEDEADTPDFAKEREDDRLRAAAEWLNQVVLRVVVFLPLVAWLATHEPIYVYVW